MFYNKAIMTLFHDLQHAGEFTSSDDNIFTTQIGHPGQSDVLQLQVQLTANKVKQVKFKAQGGITTLAAAEYLARQIVGMDLNELSELNSEMIINALELPTSRINAALLASAALATITREINNER